MNCLLHKVLLKTKILRTDARLRTKTTWLCPLYVFGHVGLVRGRGDDQCSVDKRIYEDVRFVNTNIEGKLCKHKHRSELVLHGQNELYWCNLFCFLTSVDVYLFSSKKLRLTKSFFFFFFFFLAYLYIVNLFYVLCCHIT